MRVGYRKWPKEINMIDSVITNYAIEDRNEMKEITLSETPVAQTVAQHLLLLMMGSLLKTIT